MLNYLTSAYKTIAIWLELNSETRLLLKQSNEYAVKNTWTEHLAVHCDILILYPIFFYDA